MLIQGFISKKPPFFFFPLPCPTPTYPNPERATPPPPRPCGVTSGSTVMNHAAMGSHSTEINEGVPPASVCAFNVGCICPQRWLRVRPTSIIAGLSVPPRQTSVVLARTIKVEQCPSVHQYCMHRHCQTDRKISSESDVSVVQKKKSRSRRNLQSESLLRFGSSFPPIRVNLSQI